MAFSISCSLIHWFCSIITPGRSVDSRDSRLTVKVAFILQPSTSVFHIVYASPFLASVDFSFGTKYIFQGESWRNSMWDIFHHKRGVGNSVVPGFNFGGLNLIKQTSAGHIL